MNNGAAASSATLPNPGIAWRVIGSGDFNSDSKSDILWQSTDGTPMIWTMNGPTVTAQTTLLDPGSGWIAIGTGDFNGDSKSDILYQYEDGTPSDGALSIWLMNNTTIMQAAGLPNPGSGWHAIGTGDFNNDGKSDIVFQYNDGGPATGTVSIWEMNGTHITQTALLPDPGAAWRLVGTGDFNNDGKSDLLFQNTDGTPMIWMMNGTSVASSATLTNPGSGWRAISTGDYNGDGKSDILYQFTDGTPSVWAMNGTTVIAAGGLPNPGGANGINWHANSG